MNTKKLVFVLEIEMDPENCNMQYLMEQLKSYYATVATVKDVRIEMVQPKLKFETLP